MRPVGTVCRSTSSTGHASGGVSDCETPSRGASATVRRHPSVWRLMPEWHSADFSRRQKIACVYDTNQAEPRESGWTARRGAPPTALTFDGADSASGHRWQALVSPGVANRQCGWQREARPLREPSILRRQLLGVCGNAVVFCKGSKRANGSGPSRWRLEASRDCSSSLVSLCGIRSS